MSENTLPTRLKAVRAAAGLSQREMADRVGISNKVLSFYEQGRNTPDAVFIKRFAEVNQCSADYLLGLSNVKTQQADVQTICRQTGLSEAAVRQLERYGKSCQPYLNRMLEAGNVYMLATDLIRLRESYRSWTLESEQAHDERQQAVQKQFGQEYELLSPQDKLTMQEYNLDGEWNDLLRVLKKEARQDGQKSK